MLFNKSKYLLAGFFLVTIFSLNTFASNDTTSALRGDAGVASANVSVTHVPTGITKSTTADANGVFSVGNLRPGGPYRRSLTCCTQLHEEVGQHFRKYFYR